MLMIGVLGVVIVSLGSCMRLMTPPDPSTFNEYENKPHSCWHTLFAVGDEYELDNFNVDHSDDDLTRKYKDLIVIDYDRKWYKGVRKGLNV